MNCPDTNRLVEVGSGGRGDLDLLAHLQNCPDCRAELRIIRLLPAALRPEFDVPGRLVGRVMMDLADSRIGHRDRALSVQLVASAVLAAVTAGVTVLATGLIVASGPVDLMAFSLAAGLAAGLVHFRLDSLQDAVAS